MSRWGGSEFIGSRPPGSLLSADACWLKASFLEERKGPFLFSSWARSPCMFKCDVKVTVVDGVDGVVSWGLLSQLLCRSFSVLPDTTATTA
eukprot:1143656-Pelagomonas_calceolata.AAC.1